MTEHRDIVLEALRRAPDFDSVDLESATLQRQGGLTNLVYRVDVDGRSVIVRIPGEGTNEYIDRAIEAHNARAAASAGVSARVIHAEPDSGIMICECIDGIKTMTPELFKTRSRSPARAARSLAKLHGSGKKFEFRFELFAMIDEYLKILSTKDIKLPDGYHDVMELAEPVKTLMLEHPAELAPCHCDPLCENFLDDGERMWIVDWEYSGMNDPLWDVGDLSVEAGMNAEQDAELLEGYFGRKPTAAEMGRVVIYKAMCDLLWTLWGLIQYANGNPAEDFWAYATSRFERCKALMQDPEFEMHIEAVRGYAD